MNIRNHVYKLIDFLRLPRPQGERRTDPDLSGELDEVKINLLPPRLRVAASAEQGWGWGRCIDFQAFCNSLCNITDSQITYYIPVTTIFVP